MMRVIIVDDEPLARRRLRVLLGRHSDVVVVAECGSGTEAVTAVDQHDPDALFLDVQMPGLSGLGVLEALGPRAVPAVVFVTAFDAHAVRAFEHEAIDYLLKPVGEERFNRTLVRVRERLAERAARESSTAHGSLPAAAPAASSAAGTPSLTPLVRIPIRATGKITFVEVADVEWVEADGDYLRLHTTAKSHLYRSTLSALEQRLDPRDFVRVHRSALVRRSSIVSLEPYYHGEYIIRTRRGARLRLSRSYRDRLPLLLGEANATPRDDAPAER